MRLELVLDDARSFVHQNFSFAVRIVNPNNFPVTFRGFEMDSYIEPRLLWIRKDGRTQRLYYGGAGSAWTNTSRTVGPGESLSKQRFLWKENFASLWWPNEPGEVTLQLETSLSSAVKGEEDIPITVVWDRPIVSVLIEAPDGANSEAWEWLEQRFRDYEGAAASGTLEEGGLGIQMIGIYSKFLDRYPDSAYSPAVRWETAQLIANLHQDIKATDAEPILDLFTECIEFCLEREGAYVDPILEWIPKRGGNRYLTVLMWKNKWSTFTRLIEKLDRQHSNDEEGRVYRRLLRLGATGTIEDIRSAADEYRRRFPESSFGSPDLAVQFFQRQRNLSDGGRKRSGPADDCG
jgi:hypothetical protein